MSLIPPSPVTHPGALAYLDFVGGVYEFDGAASTLATIFDGTDGSGFDASGMGVFEANANRPQATTALRSAVYAALADGLTFVFEMDYGGDIDDGPLVIMCQATTLDASTHYIEAYTDETFQADDKDSWYASATAYAAAGIDPTGIIRTAFTFNRPNGSDFEAEVAHNGTAAQMLDPPGYDESTMLTALGAMFFGGDDGEFWYFHTARFRKIEIYPAMTSAAMLVASAEGLALSIAGAPIAEAMVGLAYFGFTVQAQGGVPPYTYSVHSGSLPAGLTLDSSTGVISGTPSATGVSSGIVIRATDDDGGTADLDAFTITVRNVLAGLTHSSRTLTSGTSFTKSAVDFGPADSSRIIAVALAVESDGSKTITGVTIGGVTATKAVSGGATDNTFAIWFAAVPTGTSGDVVVTTSSGSSYLYLFAYALYGLASVADTDKQTRVSGGLTYGVTIDVPDDSIGLALWFAPNATGATWANIEERAALNNGTDQRCETAMSPYDTAASVAVGVTATGSNALGTLLAVAFQ
ncbi:hypothetical protein GR217_34470 [Rhizobium leguminosarum]|uniref:Uncharacterized protein n=1 Tax=Rhizobium ruizarguesonis TaxID=2081791 RepID=A0AAE4YXA9_9HYPH|nr:Ig domain-containing protein [Rhizobium ruizarguesonis]NEI52726.1 hypothetical protein [Rhizobium ruizarguesonis]